MLIARCVPESGRTGHVVEVHRIFDRADNQDLWEEFQRFRYREYVIRRGFEEQRPDARESDWWDAASSYYIVLTIEGLVVAGFRVVRSRGFCHLIHGRLPLSEYETYGFCSPETAEISWFCRTLSPLLSLSLQGYYLLYGLRISTLMDKSDTYSYYLMCGRRVLLPWRRTDMFTQVSELFRHDRTGRMTAVYQVEPKLAHLPVGYADKDGWLEELDPHYSQKTQSEAA